MTQATYDNLESLVGQELGVSEWHQIDQKQINLFADATGDHQFIHVDEEKAGALFGSTIAHGYLTLSLLPYLGGSIMKVDGVTRGINYGTNKVRFTNMVPVNSKVRVRQKMLNVVEKAGGKQMTVENTIEIEGQDRPACVAETLSILYGA